MSPLWWDFTVTHVTGKNLTEVVGATGFEPATPCAQGGFSHLLRLLQEVGRNGLLMNELPAAFRYL